MYILGINAYHGDASAVLIKDGQLVGALEEERYRRVKHWAGFPTLAIRELLKLEGIEGDAVSHAAISRNPRAHFLRKASFALRHAQWNMVRDRLRNAAKVGSVREPLADALGVTSANTPKIHFVEHHASHLASSFFVSPFSDAACCAIDGFGDFVSTSMAVGRANDVETFQRVFFPHSLGVMYTAVTQYLGFMGYGDEFKVMGLAPWPWSGKAVIPLCRKIFLRPSKIFSDREGTLPNP